MATFWGQGNILQVFLFHGFHITSSREKKVIKFILFGVDLSESPTWEIAFCITCYFVLNFGKDEATSRQAWHHLLVKKPLPLK